MDTTSASTSACGGLLSVGRRSIRRLAHAVKRKRGAATGDTGTTPAAMEPARNTASNEVIFGKRKEEWQERNTKKYVFPGAATKETQDTEAARKGCGQRGASFQRKNRGKRSFLRGTSKVGGTPLLSWPFKRSHGKLDLQDLSPQGGQAVWGRTPRHKRVKREIIVTRKTDHERVSRGAREEGTLGGTGEQRVFWKDKEGEEEDGGQRGAKRRRRRSQSDADVLHRINPCKHTRVVSSGLCTPKRPRREEQTRRCKPKKLAVPKEEFLSLKKKLEWELTFNLYCRQKKEFMEINKGMYE